MKASWIVLVAIAACSDQSAPDDIVPAGRCSTMVMSGDRCDQYGTACTWSEGIDGSGTSPLTRCDCLGDTWRCVTVDHPCPDGVPPSSDATCSTGDACEYADWEHDCSCSCAANHRWDCTPGTVGSSQVCPRAYLDAGVTP